MPGSLGQYVLEGELGRGGAGTVFRARHGPTGTLRALKVLTGLPDPEVASRFRREAEALARVGGDGVVPVHEVVVDRGTMAIAMSLMPGGSLQQRLRAKGRLRWREAVGVAVAVAGALERCHAAGLIHRDLKPANVLLDEEGRPRIADFGIVRDLSAATLTETGTVLGTPAYMPPEQIEGKPVDARADVYALGVMLHELVMGKVPFEARSPYEHLRAKASGRRDRLAGATKAPPLLDAAIDRALAPDPAARYATAAEMRQDLEAVLAARRARSPRFIFLVAFVLVAVTLAAGLEAARRRAVSSGAPVESAPGPPGERRPVTPTAIDPGPGRLVRRHRNAVRAVAFSRDATRIASASGALMTVSDREGVPIRELSSPDGDVGAMAFSSDGTRLLSGAADGTVRLWSVERPDGKSIAKHDGAVVSVAFVPDGATAISTGDDRWIKRSYLDGPSEPMEQVTEERPVTATAVAPDGKMVIFATADGELNHWPLGVDANDGIRIGHHESVARVAVSREGVLVSGGSDGRVRIWSVRGDMRDRERPRVPPICHAKPVTAVALAAGNILSSSQDGMVFLSPLAGGKELRELRFASGVTDADLADDGSIVVGLEDGSVYLVR